MVKSSLFDKWFLYLFLGIAISLLADFLMGLDWKGMIVSLIICELLAFGLYAFKLYNSKVDDSVKYHSCLECRDFIVDWIRDHDLVEVIPYVGVADSEEGISTYGLPDKRGLLSQIYFGTFISTDAFPKYFYVALNAEIVDNDSTFSNKIEKQMFPQNLDTERLDALRQRMCNSKADVPIVTKSQGYSQRIDPSGTITTNREEKTNADDLEDDVKSEVKK